MSGLSPNTFFLFTACYCIAVHIGCPFSAQENLSQAEFSCFSYLSHIMYITLRFLAVSFFLMPLHSHVSVNSESCECPKFIVFWLYHQRNEMVTGELFCLWWATAVLSTAALKLMSAAYRRAVHHSLKMLL